jgi:uncharacterized cupredoxin-like copper-binding protein
MKIAVAAASAVLVFALGFGIAAASPWHHDRYPGMSGTPGSMTNGSTMGGRMHGAPHGSMTGGAQHGSMMGGALAGTEAAPPAIAGAREVTITADDLRFSPSTITVKTGEAVNIVVVNADDVVHDFTIPGFGVHVTVPAGQRTTIGLQPTTPGSYPFLCTVAGHAQAGMRGTLAVSS